MVLQVSCVCLKFVSYVAFLFSSVIFFPSAPQRSWFSGHLVRVLLILTFFYINFLSFIKTEDIFNHVHFDFFNISMYIYYKNMKKLNNCTF